MHPRAGQKALSEDLVDVESLLDSYYDLHPDPSEPEQAVSFGTSGHRGSSLDTKFKDRKSTRLNSSHVAISYAVFCLKKKKLAVDANFSRTLIPNHNETSGVHQLDIW